jgi:hypothetical protein
VTARPWWKPPELRVNGLSAASTLEEMSAVLQRMAVLQAVRPADAADDRTPKRRDRPPGRCAMPADETQLLYSLCLHGRGELGWRRTNTPPDHGAAAAAGLQARCLVRHG